MTANIVTALGAIVASVMGALAAVGSRSGPGWQLAVCIPAALVFVAVPLCSGWLWFYRLLDRVPTSSGRTETPRRAARLLVTSQVAGFIVLAAALVLSFLLAGTIAGAM